MENPAQHLESRSAADQLTQGRACAIGGAPAGDVPGPRMLVSGPMLSIAKEHGTWLVFDIYNDDFIMSEGLKNGMLPESLAKEK